MNFIQEDQVKNWKQLKEIINRDFTTRKLRDYWIFRGQSNHEWPLATTLERLDLADEESDIIEEFKRHAHLYSSTQNVDTIIEWISLMQHHGAPTRLLDWTRSPYVAIFFALNDVQIRDKPKEKGKQDEKKREDRQRYCAFYAINTYFICQKLIKDDRYKFLFEKGVIPKAIVPNLTSAPLYRQRFEEILFRKENEKDNTPPEIIPLVPFNSHARLNIQQGLFLCPTQTIPPFQDILATTTSSISKAFVRKYLIPVELKPQIITELNHMNINDATLFPGIEGYSRFLRKKYRLERERVLVNGINAIKTKEL